MRQENFPGMFKHSKLALDCTEKELHQIIEHKAYQLNKCYLNSYSMPRAVGYSTKKKRKIT